MPVYLKGNYIFTSPGKKAFLASSNFVNYIELGKKGITAYYLEAKIENNEFIVNGKLFDSKSNFLCTLKNNHLEEMHKKCRMVINNKGQGYRIFDEDNNVVIELFLKDLNTCILRGTFYDDKGNIIAEGNEEDFLLYKGPAVLGKSNGSLGIVMN